jgi:hypothetical protein
MPNFANVSTIGLLCLIKRRSTYIISSELSLAWLMLFNNAYDKH